MSNFSIGYEQVDKVGFSGYVAEASELHIPPGKFPVKLKTNIGNGLPFVIAKVLPDGSAFYKQTAGCVELTILND